MKKTLFFVFIALASIQVSLGQIIIASDYYVNTDTYDTIRGNLVTGSITYNPETRTLTLENATIFERTPVEEMETTLGALYFGGVSENNRFDTINIKLLGYNTLAPHSPVSYGIQAIFCSQINIIGPGSLVVGGIPMRLDYVQELTIQEGANVRFPQPSASGFNYIGIYSGYERSHILIDSSTFICEYGVPFQNIGSLQLSRCHVGYPEDAYFNETIGTMMNTNGTTVSGFFSIIPGEGTAVPQYSDEKVVMTVYPNPARDVVNVQCTMNNVQGVEVIDVYGKVVRTVVGANNYSPLPTRINVSGLANGMYFVRVTTEEGMVTKTFVKK